MIRLPGPVSAVSSQLEHIEFLGAADGRPAAVDSQLVVKYSWCACAKCSAKRPVVGQFLGRLKIAPQQLEHFHLAFAQRINQWLRVEGLRDEGRRQGFKLSCGRLADPGVRNRRWKCHQEFIHIRLQRTGWGADNSCDQAIRIGIAFIHKDANIALRLGQGQGAFQSGECAAAHALVTMALDRASDCRIKISITLPFRPPSSAACKRRVQQTQCRAEDRHLTRPVL